jgi:hypothetical protein
MVAITFSGNCYRCSAWLFWGSEFKSRKPLNHCRFSCMRVCFWEQTGACSPDVWAVSVGGLDFEALSREGQMPKSLCRSSHNILQCRLGLGLLLMEGRQGHCWGQYSDSTWARATQSWQRKECARPKTRGGGLHGLSPRTNYTNRATAAYRRSDCQLFRIEGATWSAWRIPTAVFSVF